MTTWRALLAEQMEADNDPGPVEAYAPNEQKFDVEFDDSYGSPEGPHVLAWTAARVYFPVVHDGSESLRSAPRAPQPDGQKHVGRW